MLNLIPSKTDGVITYNVKHESFLKLAEMLKDIQKDYVNFFTYNNKRASVRLRYQLRDLMRECAYLRNDVLETRKRREEEGFIKKRGRKVYNEQ